MTIVGTLYFIAAVVAERDLEEGRGRLGAGEGGGGGGRVGGGGGGGGFRMGNTCTPVADSC